MAFGLIFSSILAGLSLAVWGLWQGYSIPAAILMHMLGGSVGAVVFLACATMRPNLTRQEFSSAKERSAP
ncbi:hypothetical protein EYE35_14475 [Cereibacter sphaeroides]|nr:hypothetical protein EYE35_14475 [Cereibacter sphaeroides]